MRALVAALALTLVLVGWHTFTDVGKDVSTVAAPTSTWDELVAVLTHPDEGAGGVTYRWARPAVTYQLELGGYPAEYVDVVRAAFATGGAWSGIAIRQVSSGGDIVVERSRGNGATLAYWPDDSHAITRAHIRLGCCRPRAAWEDVLQAFGPAGDRARSGLFSQDVEGAQAPGPFEECVVRTLYRFPPGTTRARLYAVPPEERCA